jgi:hypothetical protein
MAGGFNGGFASGFHDGGRGFHDGDRGFHDRGFGHRFGGHGFYPYSDYDSYAYDYPYAYGDSYYDDGCYTVRRRVHTTHGWRVRPVQVCG